MRHLLFMAAGSDIGSATIKLVALPVWDEVLFMNYEHHN
jgi:hypothetical protein